MTQSRTITVIIVAKKRPLTLSFARFLLVGNNLRVVGDWFVIDLLVVENDSQRHESSGYTFLLTLIYLLGVSREYQQYEWLNPHWFPKLHLIIEL